MLLQTAEAEVKKLSIVLFGRYSVGRLQLDMVKNKVRIVAWRFKMS